MKARTARAGALALLLAAAALTALPAPAIAGGYGRYRWGEQLSAVKQKQKKLRTRKDVEPVALERRVFAAVMKASEAAARAEGRAALRAFRKRPKPKTRLSAYSYWVRLAELPSQVVLQFADERLYAAEVGILYKADQVPAVEEVMGHVRDKYGAPVEERRAANGPERAWTFELEAGTLDILDRPPQGKERGMVTLTYRAQNLAEGVDRYVEGLRGRMRQFEQEAAEAAAARDEASEDARLKGIREHL